ncbi:uncharacterized protein LOC144704362 [Wolffia australiana]
MKLWVLFPLLVVAWIIPSPAFSKQCTNTGVSHSLRYELSLAKNANEKKEITTHHLHLNPTEESAWMELLSRKLLKGVGDREKFDWLMLYRKIKGTQNNIPGDNAFLRELSLHDVRIDPDSRHGQAQRTNLEYLLMLDVDQLVWSFRKQAGLQNPGQPYGGWEWAGSELRGHFVGHYMSAAAKMWASTHNDTLYKKMTAIVEALNVCQNKTGTGYLSAFPTELFDRFEALQTVWAPYYTVHKIMAGLLDQYLYAGNKNALKMVVWMAEYFGNRVDNVIRKYSLERHWNSLNEETGGMNDVLYNLYSVTGDPKHLTLAHLFDKPCFLGLLAIKADSLSGFHANTHIPIVVGAQRRYEITGDPLYKDIATYFMDIVNSSHSYATGGTSFHEFWTDPKRLADTLMSETEESCTTYNMLKVARNLFRWTKEMSYADYYERAITNGVLSIQRGTDPGVMIYMLPLGAGISKAKSEHGWGTPFNSFWCCYGTGIESFSKLGDSIYFEQGGGGTTPSLYVIQYVSSSLNWKSAGVIVRQSVQPLSSLDSSLRVQFGFSPLKASSQASELKLRIPSWTSREAKATLNGESLAVPPPGSFLSVTRNWSGGDKLTLELPLSLRTEPIEDDRPGYSSKRAILFGPYLLAGLTSGDRRLKAGSAAAVSLGERAQLGSLTQTFAGGARLVLTAGNGTLTMAEVPGEGSDGAVRATFRLAPAGTGAVALEPLDLPGMAVAAPPGPAEEALVVRREAPAVDSVFRVLHGLDGKAGSVSLELVSRPGCYLEGAAELAAGKVARLACSGGGELSPPAASFRLEAPLKGYHPISFVALGENRNFLLEPLNSLRDESYTVYFDTDG